MRPYYLLPLAQKQAIAARRSAPALSAEDDKALALFLEATNQLAAANARKQLAELVDSTDNLRALRIPAPFDELIVELVNYHRNRGSLAYQFVTAEDYKGIPGEQIALLAQWAEHSPCRLYDFMLKLVADA
jgi:hypothetical protein